MKNIGAIVVILSVLNWYVLFYFNSILAILTTPIFCIICFYCGVMDKYLEQQE